MLRQRVQARANERLRHSTRRRNVKTSASSPPVSKSFHRNKPNPKKIAKHAKAKTMNKKKKNRRSKSKRSSAARNQRRKRRNFGRHKHYANTHFPPVAYCPSTSCNRLVSLYSVRHHDHVVRRLTNGFANMQLAHPRVTPLTSCLDTLGAAYSASSQANSTSLPFSSDHLWLVDSGASDHMTSSLDDFIDYQPLPTSRHINGVDAIAEGIGRVELNVWNHNGKITRASRSETMLESICCDLEK